MEQRELALLEADLASLEARLADPAHTGRTPREQLDREWEFRNELRARIEALRQELARPLPLPGGLPADRAGLWSPLPLHERPPAEESKGDLPPSAFELAEAGLPDRHAITRQVATLLNRRWPDVHALRSLAKTWRGDPALRRLLVAALRTAGATATADRLAEGPAPSVETKVRPLPPTPWLTMASELPSETDGLTVTQRLVLNVMRSAAPAGRPFVRLGAIAAEVAVRDGACDLVTVERALVALGHPSLRRIPLVEVQGFSGRFTPPETHLTHARLSRAGLGVLDETLSLPILLINGAEGVDACLPPHSPSEMIRSCLHLLVDSRARVSDLRPDRLIGPDLPDGGLLLHAGIQNAWERGAGTLHGRADVRVEVDAAARARVVLDKFPWPLAAAEVRKDLLELLANGWLDGVTEIVDQTSATANRLVLELEHLAFSGPVTTVILKSGVAQRWWDVEFRIQNPTGSRRADLLDLLRAFIEHRREVAVKRLDQSLSQARLQAQDREAVCVALALLEPVQAVMRASLDDAEAVEGLMKFMRVEHREVALTTLPFPPSHGYQTGFTERQARYLVSQRKLASRRREVAEQDWAAQLGVSERAKALLNDRQAVLEIVRQELREALAQFDEPRRSRLVSW